MPDWRGVRELARALRRREVSSVELTRDALARLERDGARLHAVASLVTDRAMREARSADRALREGRAASPLVGIPYGAKDNIAVANVPLTIGSDLFARQVPARDANAITRLTSSRAVLVAKLAMIELAGAGGYRLPSASRQGATRTPWRTDRWSGGSSSGSAAAVAGGLLPFTLGSETGGSMALPSAYCGATSIRPTFGLVGRTGVFPLAWSLDKIGPMARTADDCALVLAAVAGPDPQDSGSSGKSFRALRGGNATRTVRNLRVGIVDVPDDAVPDTAVREALRQGQRDFVRAVGRMHRRVALPAFPYDAMLTLIYFAEGAAVLSDVIRSERLKQVRDPAQRAGLRASLDVSAADYLNAMRLRVPLAAQLGELFREADVLLSISRTRTATRVSEARDAGIRRARGATVHAGSVDLIAAGNLAGLPAVYFPCGIAADGLPVGLQLVGPRFSDALLLAAVDAYQHAAGVIHPS